MTLRLAPAVSALLTACSSCSSVFAQVDCFILDPRASVSSEKEGRIQGSLGTLYKIAKAEGSIEGKLKSEIRNLQQGTGNVSEKYAVSARMIYLFCGMVANAKDIGTERKSQLFKELHISIREQSSEAIQPPRQTDNKQKVGNAQNRGVERTNATKPKLPEQTATDIPRDVPVAAPGETHRASLSKSSAGSDFRLKFLGSTPTPDAHWRAWASPSGRLLAYCSKFCKSIVVKMSDDMKELARIDTGTLNSEDSVNPSMFGLGFSHDDSKVVISYVSGLDDYQSRPSKAALFNLLRRGEKEWETMIPLGGIDVLNNGSTFSADNGFVLVGNTTMVDVASGRTVGRFASGGKAWCPLADGSLASYHSRTINWVDSKPVSGKEQYDFLACGHMSAIVGTGSWVGGNWKRTAYIANGADKARWMPLFGPAWNLGDKISSDLRFSATSGGDILHVATGSVIGRMAESLRDSCGTAADWKPYASDVFWEANGVLTVWESGDLCGQGAGFARFAIR